MTFTFEINLMAIFVMTAISMGYFIFPPKFNPIKETADYRGCAIFIGDK